jgi:O-antigen ligase
MLCLSLVLVAHPELRGRHTGRKLLLFGSMVAGALLAIGPVLLRLTASDPGALDFRREWLGIAWRMVEARPILGFGLNTFSYEIVGYAPYSVSKLIDLFGSTWPVVHNIYLLVWAEQGTLGFVLFLGLLGQIFWIGVRNARRCVSERMFMLNIGALCGLVAISIDGLASFFIRVPACGRTFWIVVALVVAADCWTRRNADLRRGDPAPG